jgi:hypothetical protein
MSGGHSVSVSRRPLQRFARLRLSAFITEAKREVALAFNLRVSI